MALNASINWGIECFSCFNSLYKRVLIPIFQGCNNNQPLWSTVGVLLTPYALIFAIHPLWCFDHHFFEIHFQSIGTLRLSKRNFLSGLMVTKFSKFPITVCPMQSQTRCSVLLWKQRQPRTYPSESRSVFFNTVAVETFQFTFSSLRSLWPFTLPWHFCFDVLTDRLFIGALNQKVTNWAY